MKLTKSVLILSVLLSQGCVFGGDESTEEQVKKLLRVAKDSRHVYVDSSAWFYDKVEISKQWAAGYDLEALGTYPTGKKTFAFPIVNLVCPHKLVLEYPAHVSEAIGAATGLTLTEITVDKKSYDELCKQTNKSGMLRRNGTIYPINRTQDDVVHGLMGVVTPFLSLDPKKVHKKATGEQLNSHATVAAALLEMNEDGHKEWLQTAIDMQRGQD